jgi:hypothetical protein
MRKRDSSREDLPLRRVLVVGREERIVFFLPPRAADNGNFVALLDGEREVLNHRLTAARFLVTTTDQMGPDYLPMVGGDVIKFNLALARPLRRGSLVF